MGPSNGADTVYVSFLRFALIVLYWSSLCAWVLSLLWLRLDGRAARRRARAELGHAYSGLGVRHLGAMLYSSGRKRGTATRAALESARARHELRVLASRRPLVVRLHYLAWGALLLDWAVTSQYEKRPSGAALILLSGATLMFGVSLAYPRLRRWATARWEQIERVNSQLASEL